MGRKQEVDLLLQSKQMEDMIKIYSVRCENELGAELKAVNAEIPQAKTEMCKCADRLSNYVRAAIREHAAKTPGIKSVVAAICKLYYRHLSAEDFIEATVVSNLHSAELFGIDPLAAHIAYEEHGGVINYDTSCAINLKADCAKNEDADGRSGPNSRRYTNVDGWEGAWKIDQTAYNMADQVRIKREKYRNLNAKAKELESRLKNVAKDARTMEAGVLQDRLTKAENGESLVKMIDAAVAATTKGEYLALL